MLPSSGLKGSMFFRNVRICLHWKIHTQKIYIDVFTALTNANVFRAWFARTESLGLHTERAMFSRVRAAFVTLLVSCLMLLCSLQRHPTEALLSADTPSAIMPLFDQKRCFPGSNSAVGRGSLWLFLACCEAEYGDWPTLAGYLSAIKKRCNL